MATSPFPCKAGTIHTHMAGSDDYYQLLGVSKTANEAELKAAYRKAALQWHPDRNKDPRAAEKFKEINQAYEVLGNPEKRQAYDQYGASAFANGSSGPQQGPFSYSYRSYGGGGGAQNPFENVDFGGFSDPFEIFEQFFGGGFSGGGRSTRQRRQAYSLNISFMEAVRGVEKTIQVNGKSMTIKIPAGVDDGSRVRFGDFDIVLSVHPDPTFQRNGADIYINANIDFPSAVLGTTVEIPTLTGQVSLKIPAGTQPDTIMRLRGHGIKLPQSNHQGDQYVRLKIKIPTKITREQKDLLENFVKLGEKKKSGWF